MGKSGSLQDLSASPAGLLLLANEPHPTSLTYAPDAPGILLIGQQKPTARTHLCARQIPGAGAQLGRRRSSSQ